MNELKNYEVRIILGYDQRGQPIYTSIYTERYPEIEVVDCHNKNNEIILFQDVLDNWLQSIKESVKLQSFYKYQTTINLYLIPYIGNKDIRGLNVLVINQFLEKMASSGRQDHEGLSESTLKMIVFIIKETFQYAYNYGIRSEILGKIVIPKKQQIQYLHILEEQDRKKLIDYISNNICPIYIGIGLSLCCGIRIGEICALQGKDIDLKNRLIKIHRTMQRIKVEDNQQKTSIIISSPKTKTSKRIIPLPQFMYELIQNIKYKEEDYILSANHNYIEPRRLSRHFKKVLKTLEIDDINYHSLRHTFASLCIESGMDDRTLSEILGHSSVNITLNRYVHPHLKIKHEMMNKVIFK